MPESNVAALQSLKAPVRLVLATAPAPPTAGPPVTAPSAQIAHLEADGACPHCKTRLAKPARGDGEDGLWRLVPQVCTVVLLGRITAARGDLTRKAQVLRVKCGSCRQMCDVG